MEEVTPPQESEYVPTEILRAAEEILPYGFCNACVARVKTEIANGEKQPSAIRAAITVVATKVGETRIPLADGGFVVTPILLPMPVCWWDIRVQVTEQPPQRKGPQRRIAVAGAPLPPGMLKQSLRDLPTPPLS